MKANQSINRSINQSTGAFPTSFGVANEDTLDSVLARQEYMRAEKRARKERALKELSQGIEPSPVDLICVKPYKAYVAVCEGNQPHLLPLVLRRGLINMAMGLRVAAGKGHVGIVRLILSHFPLVHHEDIAKAIYELRLVSGEALPDLEPWMQGMEIDYRLLFISACKRGDLPSVKLLCERLNGGASPAVIGFAYQGAAEGGHREVMNYVESRYKVDNDDGIFGACYGRQRALFDSLTGRRPTKNPHAVLKAAHEGGDPEIMDRVQIYGIPSTILEIGCRLGRASVIPIAEGLSDVSRYISIACLTKQYGLLRHLLRLPYTSLNGALIDAARHKTPHLVNALLNFGNPRPDPNVAIRTACYLGRSSILLSLIRHGATDFLAGADGLNSRWRGERNFEGYPCDADFNAIGERLRLSAACIEMGDDQRKELMDELRKCWTRLEERDRLLWARMETNPPSTDGRSPTWDLYFAIGNEIYWTRKAIEHLKCCMALLRICPSREAQ